MTINRSPDAATADFHAGGQFYDRKQWQAALTSYDHAIALVPDFAEAHFRRGNVLFELGRWDAALASYGDAIRLKRDHAEAYFNLGVLLDQLDELEAAATSYDLALLIRPNYAEAAYNRGNVLLKLDRWEASLASYALAIASKADYAEAYANRAVVLSALNQVDLAIASCNQAIAIKHDHAEAYSNRGLLLQELQQWDAAVASCNQAIAIRSDYAEAYFNRSIVSLLHGDFTQGWRDYERRRTGMRFAQPPWLGRESLAGRTILTYSEQGLGDTLQFCRYANLLAALGANVLLEVEKPLASLLANLDGVSRVITRGEELPAFDYQCPLLSLPLAFNTNLQSIPAQTRYLHVDAARVAHWRKRLEARTGATIGLRWSGNATYKRDHHRSIPLAELMQHLPAEFQYVSLQKDLRDADRETLRGSANICHFGDELGDFSDAAALCESLDLVISVDTSVAHLSAGLGRETWILLPATPDWRWLLDRRDSPWYPTATLYRQQRIGDWGAVLERLAADLLARFGAPVE